MWLGGIESCDAKSDTCWDEQSRIYGLPAESVIHHLGSFSLLLPRIMSSIVIHTSKMYTTSNCHVHHCYKVPIGSQSLRKLENVE